MEAPTACILLAAGGSTRLGSAKQLIDVDGEPLVVHVARRLIALEVGPVAAVIGGNAVSVGRTLSGLNVTTVGNVDWARGIGTSIRAGIKWAEGRRASAALIVLCDQPEVSEPHLRNLVEIGESNDADVVATAYGDVRGVPAWFAQSTFDALLALPNDRGARAIIDDETLRVAAIPNAAAAVDLDTPADVARWRAARSGESPTRRI